MAAKEIIPRLVKSESGLFTPGKCSLCEEQFSVSRVDLKPWLN
jgi:hypothetical protein